MAEEKKAGFFKRIASSTTRFFKDLKGEMKKIVWPSKKQIINNTGVVIVFVIIAAIAVGGLDFVLNALVRLFNS